MVVHRRACNILELIEHIKRWRTLPNPANVLGDDGAKTPWSQIVYQLRLLDVDITKIDVALYDELRSCEGNALPAQLFKIQQWQKSGELERRFAKWVEEQAKAFENNADAQNDSSLALNRSHSWSRDGGVDPEIARQELRSAAQAGKAQRVEQMQLEKQADGSLGWFQGFKTDGRAAKRCFEYPAWRYIIYIVLLGVGIGGWVYSEMGKKNCQGGCINQV